MKFFITAILFGVLSLFAVFLGWSCSDSNPVTGNFYTLPTPPPTATPCGFPFAICTPTPTSCVALGNTVYIQPIINTSNIVYVQYTALNTMTLQAMSIDINGSANQTYELGVYSDSSNQPGSLLAETGPITLSAPVSNAPVTSALQFTVPIANGTNYWIASYATAAIAYYNFFGSQRSSTQTYVGPTFPATAAASAPTTGVIFNFFATNCP